MVLTGRQAFGDYESAERDCDQWAGDTGGHAAVVEDFDHGTFYVMSYADAERYVQRNDAEIQYHADGSQQGE